MKNDNWRMISKILKENHYEDCIKGFISYIYEINDEQLLTKVYLNYMHDDNTTEILNDKIVKLIERII